MFIETCSLGCSNGQGSLQVSCSIVNVAQNVEITVLFSRPIELSSVNAASFRITNTLNGSSPVGSFTLDPTNARRLIFRPALTFDAIGNPIFALDPNQTYEILIPGQAQGDPGPYITGTNGKRNETRLRCTIATTQGLLDPVPGAPVASSQARRHQAGARARSNRSSTRPRARSACPSAAAPTTSSRASSRRSTTS